MSVETAKQNREGLHAIVAALELSDSYSIAKRIDLTGAQPAQLQGVKDNLRSQLANPVTKAQHTLGRKYVVESGAFVTRANDLMVVMVVTRTQ